MAENYLEFPYPNAKDRLNGYEYYDRLFNGQHFDAFTIKVDDPKYTKEYNRLRYIAANFAGLISKVAADFLFSEPLSVSAQNNQEWFDALVHENSLHVQNYESELGNSAKGDALYKLRIGKRNSEDEKSTIIIEDITPAIYFPHLEQFNVRQKPQKEELAWKFKHGDKEYLRQEIHTPGKIEYHVYLLNGGKIAAEVLDPVSELGFSEWEPEEETGIDRNLLVHIPNWKTGSRYFGISDYFDLDSLFYAINNRLTKTDNILDKHSDPILAVPEGVLDEDGKVRKEKLGMIEIPDGAQGTQGKPEYIVWNANLDSAFKEIDKLMELLLMISETSPDIFGMGKGQSDSGRALKYKLLRTIAKAARKKLYYDRAIKEVLYISQLLAKAHPDVEVGGMKFVGKVEVPELEWQDGIPIDEKEQIENEVMRMDAGLTTTKDAIKRIDNVDDEAAQKTAEEINKENSLTIPKTTARPDFVLRSQMTGDDIDNQA